MKSLTFITSSLLNLASIKNAFCTPDTRKASCLVLRACFARSAHAYYQEAFRMVKMDNIYSYSLLFKKRTAKVYAIFLES